MAKTKVSDVIVPSEFAPYMLERTTELSEIIKAGIAERDPEFDNLASGGGKTVDLPFWREITGDSQVLSDSSPLTVSPITAGQDTAAIHNRGQAWGTNDLAKWLSGSDPAGRIAEGLAGFWARDRQRMLMKMLEGLFATGGQLATTHRLNIYSDVTAASITDAMRLTGETFIDGLQKLGDANQKIVAVAMHSDVEAKLKKLELIDEIPGSEGLPALKVFQGRRVIVDDACPKTNGTNAMAYTTYMFGRGAVGWGNGNLDPEEAIETDRDILASDSLLVTRFRFILHPRGVRWTGNPAGASPTNAEMTAIGNWSKVYEDKNIRIVAVKHNV